MSHHATTDRKVHWFELVAPFQLKILKIECSTRAVARLNILEGAYPGGIYPPCLTLATALLITTLYWKKNLYVYESLGKNTVKWSTESEHDLTFYTRFNFLHCDLDKIALLTVEHNEDILCIVFKEQTVILSLP